MPTVYTLLLLLICVVSCNTQDAKQKLQGDSKTVAEVTIETAALRPSKEQRNAEPPQIVSLADRPPPRRIEIPVKTGDYFIKKNHLEEKRIDLEPPVVSAPPIFFSMEQLTTLEGLSLDTFHGGTFDREGNLWVATDGVGVSKYNGQFFTNYTPLSGIPHGVVWRILEDRQGNIWFATDGGGLAKYNGEFFTIYTTEEGLASNYLRGILEDKAGNLWFSTYGSGISKFDGKTFTNFSTSDGLPNNKVFGMTEDKKGNLWFCTDNGLSKFDGKSFFTYTIADGLVSNHTRAVIEDRNGNLWIGTDQWGVSKYNGKEFINFTTKEGLNDNVIWHIMEDKRGNIWFATDVGASEYNGQTFTTYSKSNGLTDISVRYILEDKEGNIWFLTAGEGIIKYQGKFITNYIMKNYVRSIIEDNKGKLWISTEGSGIYEYDGKTFTNYTIKQGLGDNGIECSFKDKEGNIWFGSQEGGVSKYDGKSFTTYTTDQGLPDNWVWSIQQDEKGHFWFITDKHGVAKFDGSTFTHYTTEQGLVSNDLRSSLIDKKGNIWFGSDSGGISKYDGKKFTNYTEAEGLLDNRVWGLFEDHSGNLWVTSLSRGFNRFDGSTFLSYNTEDGIPDNSVVNFSFTKDDKLAIGTETGIAILEGFAPLSSPDEQSIITIPWQNNLKNEELKKYKPVFEVYNIKRGYNIKDVNAGQNAMYLDSDGILWIGTGSVKTSLVRLDYSALNRTYEPPNLAIQKIKVNNENVVWSDLSNKYSENDQKREQNGVQFPSNVTEEVIIFGHPLSESKRKDLRKKFGHIRFRDLNKFTYTPEHLELPHTQNSLTVDFGAIEPALPGDVIYQYKLEGYNSNWSPQTNSPQATLGNLFEGNYHLKIRAQSPFGVWSEPLTYAFKILPPWYRAWWAYLLYALSSLILLYLILLWRTTKLRERQKELQQIVTERTTELVNEKKKSDALLLNILPVQVAEELKEKGSAKTQVVESVTILFTDFKNFTRMAEILTAEELVQEMDDCYRGFERIISKYNIEKIKTTGDSFMAAGGIPVPTKTHAKDVVNAALEIVKFMEEHKEIRKQQGKEYFGIRIGIHTGPVIAGVVGSKKFAYDIWGDAVNLASRMESSGEDGRVNISESTYQMVKDDFSFIYRGRIAVKGKGEIEMYFVTGKAHVDKVSSRRI